MRTIALAVLLALSAPAAAQDVLFDARRHLPEFDECEASEYALLYPLRDFLVQNEKPVTPAELEELRARWEKERTRVAAEIERIRSVPAEAALWELRKALKPHRYLGQIVYTRVDTFAPFYFFVKRPDSDEPTYYRTVAEGYGEWFRELERQFVANYARPLGLERRADHLVYPVFVLDSSGAYKDYADAVETTGLYAARAHYEAELGIAITYENPYQGETRSQQRRAALHELVHALQHAYSPDPKAMPKPVWFNEGLADYLSYCEGLVPAALSERKVDLEALQVVVALAQIPELIDAGLFPIEELVAIESYQQAFEHLAARSGGMLFQIAGEDATIPLLYAQSNLWMCFLHQGEKGRHKEALLRYIGSTLRGDGSLAAFRTAFAGTEPAALDRAFRQWLNEQSGKLLRTSAGIPLDPSRADAVAPSAASAASAPAAPAFAPAALLPDAADPEIAFALAIARARRGELGPALEELGALEARLEPPLRERVAREVARVTGLRDLRRRFFEHMAARPADKVALQVGGQKVLAPVIALEGETLRLGKSKSGIEKVELDALDSLLLAELVREKKYGFDAGWAPAYAFVLHGDERWKKLLPAGDAAAQALRADAERDYPARLRLARAAGELARLSAAGPPSAETAEAALESARALGQEFADLPLVRSKRTALQGLARAALTELFGSQGLVASLRGKVETLAGGRVRLSYAFDSAEELADWTQTGYLASLSGGLARADFTVDGGWLRAPGFACMRHVLAFQSALALSCRFRYRVTSQSFDPGLRFLLGCNDDGRLSFAAADAGGGIDVIDLATGFRKQGLASGKGVVLNETYTLELRFDGQQRLESRINGEPSGQSDCGPRKQGGVFLFTSTELPLEVDQLVIEGTPTQDSLTVLREQWIERRLAECGLAGD
jgi:hypothetical protein